MRADRQRDRPPASKRRIHGRDEDLALVHARLAEGERLVTLRGPPGVGKTTLAHVVATELGLEGKRALVVSLAGATSRGGALAEIARALGLPVRTSNAAVIAERIVSRLEASLDVLVFDGIDAIREEARSVAVDLLAETTALSLLVCSRAALGSAAELVITLGPLAPAAATDLLVERARRAAPNRTIAPADASKLATRAGGLPLALEIVAGWVVSLGAREALSALDDGKLELDALDHALDASWTLLGSDERRSFAEWSVFQRSFDLDAARAVAGSPRATTHLATLVSASLLSAADTSEGARYEMLDGVREYAAKRAATLASTDAANDRLAHHLATSSRPRADLPASWKRLAEERDDLLAAWERASESDPRLALRLAVVLEPNLSAQGPPALHRSILERSIAASEAARLPELAIEHARATIDLLYALGRFDALRGHHDAARAPLARGIALAERGDDTVRRAWLSAHLSVSYRALGRLEEARALVTEAQRLDASTDDARLHATVAIALGGLDAAAGRVRAAHEAYRRAGTAARAAHAKRLEGIALFARARLDLDHADVSSAAATSEEAKRCFVVANDALYLARLVTLDGLVELRRGDVEEATRRFERALDEAFLQDDIEGELEARLGLVIAARARGDARLEERRLDDFDLAVQGTDDRSWAARRAALAPAEAATSRRANASVVLTLARDGRSFELASRVVDFGRRGPLRRILVALAERRETAPGRSMTVAELRAVGWPEEKMLHDSGTARVYMAIRRLRVLGLDTILRTSAEGYALDENVTVAWSDEEGRR